MDKTVSWLPLCCELVCFHDLLNALTVALDESEPNWEFALVDAIGAAVVARSIVEDELQRYLADRWVHPEMVANG